jgi:WD repeat-containing protein 23
MSSLPGSFTDTTDTGEEEDSEIDIRDFERVINPSSSSDSSDYSPIQVEEEEEEDSDEQVLADLEEEEEDEDDESGGTATQAQAQGGQLRIGYDPTNGQILLIDQLGNPRRLTEQDLRGTTLSLQSIRNMLRTRFGGQATRTRTRRRTNDDDDDDDEEEDADFLDDFDDDEEDEDEDYGGVKQWYELTKEPQISGINLERSGLFSRIPLKYSRAQTKNWHMPITSTSTSSSLSSYFTSREHSLGLLSRSSKQGLGSMLIPNSSGVEVSQFTSKVYSGQYSNDGDFFYTACQDFCIYIYDTASPPRVGDKSVTDSQEFSRSRRRGAFSSYDWSHRTSLKTSKIVRADPSNCRWTITDAELSDDNNWLIYSSISPRSHLVKTGKGGTTTRGDIDPEQETIDFANGFGGYGGFGIWSLRFSHDNREIVAGASDGQVMVYDVERKLTITRVNAHRDDVNAVAFGSDADSNLLLSGSDDCFGKVWDRRSIQGERPSGVLVGHTEGITWISPKGDGRYCITNGKDQAMKLWDLRMMTNDTDFDRLRLDRKNYSSGYDYRSGYYPKPRYLKHPHDTSVMTYRGHSVVSTLIRCHWSPISTTGQRYLYTGSADGRIHVYSLDGTTVSIIDRSLTHPLIDSKTGQYNDPTDWRLRSKSKNSSKNSSTRRSSMYYGGGGGGGQGVTVRDVSWHPERPEMMSTSWAENGSDRGSIAVHQWTGKTGETLQDTRERQRAEVGG